MNADETQIYEFLKESPSAFVSVTEISKRLARGRKFDEDRNWARPLLRRMEMDGLLESNPFGEYRIPLTNARTVDFKQALKTPGVSLGDTTIIRSQDVQ